MTSPDYSQITALIGEDATSRIPAIADIHNALLLRQRN